MPMLEKGLKTRISLLTKEKQWYGNNDNENNDSILAVVIKCLLSAQYCEICCIWCQKRELLTSNYLLLCSEQILDWTDHESNSEMQVLWRFLIFIN
jgi:hypothetical protein